MIRRRSYTASARNWWLLLVGRLKPGVSIEQARAEMAVLYRQTIEDELKTHDDPSLRKWTIEVTELVEGPIDTQVFTPPPDFKRVIQFTGDSSLCWTERIQLLWEWFEDALGSSGA